MIKTIKIQIALIFGLVSFSVFGQEINAGLPVLSPQTPTTGGLAKYGEIQVNESTGAISPSIPLFDYYAGKINLPLALSYSGNGVRVNQDPTWVGINWNLNPGGVITRVVKDKIDETTTTENRKFYSAEELNALPGYRQLLPNSNTFDPNTVWGQTVQTLYAEEVDTEADIFNYSFMGYSGSFYLDKDNNVHLIKYDKELSIIFNPAPGLPNNGNNKSGFTIKTAEGNTYFFGGANASESSRTWVNTGSGSTANVDYAQNAFYLYQVSFLTGGSITFHYENYTVSCNTKMGTQEHLRKGIVGSSYTKTSRILYSQIENAIKLKKITSSFNDQYVEFDIASHGHCGRMIKLTSIYLKDKNHSVLKRVNLNYLTVNKEQNPDENKFFLQKVDFLDKNNQLVYDYDLTYNDPQGLPSRDSFAQDHLGYYNGKNNTTLLPKTGNVILNAYGGLADREADVGSSKKGSLSQIKYPTGGYTNFEYELPYKGEVPILQDHYLSAFYRHPMSNYGSSSYNFVNNMHTYSKVYMPNTNDAPLDVIGSASIKAQLVIEANGSYSHQNNVLLSVIKLVNGGETVVWTNAPTGNNGNIGYPLTTTDNVIKNYNQNYSITLPTGSYVFKLSVNLLSLGPNPGPSVTSYVVANVKLDLPNGTTSTYHPGLRVKSIVSYDNNSSPKITRYYYNSLDKLNVESNSFHPNYIYVTEGHHENDLEGTGLLMDYLNLSTNSVKNLFNRDIDSHVYDYVTVSYGGDSFENGGKEMLFHNYSNYPPIGYQMRTVDRFMTEHEGHENYVDVGTNDSYQNSVLAEEKYVDKNKSVVKGVKYNYVGALSHSANNIKPYLKSDRGVANNTFFDDYLYYLYKTKAYNYRLISTETKDYFGGSLNVSSTTTQSYSPDKVSLPSSIETSNSINETKKINIYYPSDVATVGNLTPEDNTNIPLLTNKHNLAEVIKTENFVNNELVDSKQVSFKNWSGTVLPSVIKTKKGNNAATPFEERVVFHDYDFHGKPTLVSLKDGLKTKYIYNSKQQVILKIENYDTSMTIDDGLSASTPCFYQVLYPSAMVTTYEYDALSNDLIRITDPKCDQANYTYDSFGRLSQVKDKEGNVLSENKYNYKQ